MRAVGAEKVELLVDHGRDLEHAGRVEARAVGGEGAEADVAQVRDVERPVGRDGQRGRSLQLGVAGVASVS